MTYLNQITPEMTKTVDNLIARNFENATPDEIQLYAQWAAIIALQADDVESKREQREKMINEQIEQSRAKSEASIEALKAKTELAKARLKAVENGQE